MISSNELGYLMHHVFLPPKLPQKDDFDAQHEIALLKTILAALEDFKYIIDPRDCGSISSTRAMIDNLLRILDCKAYVDEGSLLAILDRLSETAFEILESTSAAKRLAVSQFPPELLVTRDFASTVMVHGNDYVSDVYQRPVQWILTSSDGADSETTKDMVIISPFEADVLLPDIERNKKVTIHLYAPRPDVSFQPLDRLDLFTLGKPFKPSLTPRNLILQLNVFASQLYLDSFGEYKELCDFLGLAWEAAKDGEEIGVGGFITPNPAKETGFKQSPISFLKILLTKIRRDCGKIDKTHLGRILNGERLKESDFEPDGYPSRDEL